MTVAEITPHKTFVLEFVIAVGVVVIDTLGEMETVLLSDSFGCEVVLPNVVVGVDRLEVKSISSSNSSSGGIGRAAGGFAARRD